MNTRRKFIICGACLLVAPIARAIPQQQRIAWIASDPAGDTSIFLGAFKDGLRSMGYIDGRNIIIEPRWGDGTQETNARLVEQLLRNKPDVIVTQGPAAGLVRKSGTTIPTVFGFSGDPIKAGFVDSFAKPGGSLTGISFMALELVGKRLQLLKELMPSMKRVAVLANPQHPGDDSEQRASREAAKALGIQIEYFDVRDQLQLEAALLTISTAHIDAMIAFPMALMMRHRQQIAAWSYQHRLPAISGWAQFAEAGNVLSYGPNLQDSFKRLSFFVDRILKGAKPSELPVELPSRVELVVNIKAARVLKLAIPQSVLLRADKVIE